MHNFPNAGIKVGDLVLALRVAAPVEPRAAVLEVAGVVPTFAHVRKFGANIVAH